jgi:AbrB family looped-hinge helix DNA binding protein
MRRAGVVEPEVTVVSAKGQIVIPAYVRNRLGLKPRSKLLVYSLEDTIILKKLTLPDVKEEMKELWREIDKKIAKHGEMSQEQIQTVIDRYRARRRKSKRA